MRSLGKSRVIPLNDQSLAWNILFPRQLEVGTYRVDDDTVAPGQLSLGKNSDKEDLDYRQPILYFHRQNAYVEKHRRTFFWRIFVFT